MLFNLLIEQLKKALKYLIVFCNLIIIQVSKGIRVSI